MCCWSQRCTLSAQLNLESLALTQWQPVHRFLSELKAETPGRAPAVVAVTADTTLGTTPVPYTTAQSVHIYLTNHS